MGVPPPIGAVGGALGCGLLDNCPLHAIIVLIHWQYEIVRCP